MTSRTTKATTAPHKATCLCGKCVHRRPVAGLAEPTTYEIEREERLAKRIEALRRVLYTNQRAVVRAERLLAQLAPTKPGKLGKGSDPMQAIRDAIAQAS